MNAASAVLSSPRGVLLGPRGWAGVMAAAVTLLAGAASAQTLAQVQAADVLKCGVNSGLAGFAAPDASGRWDGFDVAQCRAVAAAVLGDQDDGAIEVRVAELW